MVYIPFAFSPAYPLGWVHVQRRIYGFYHPRELTFLLWCHLSTCNSRLMACRIQDVKSCVGTSGRIPYFHRRFSFLVVLPVNQFTGECLLILCGRWSLICDDFGVNSPLCVSHLLLYDFPLVRHLSHLNLSPRAPHSRRYRFFELF